jgi:peptide/nickel transport system permease protein
MSGHEKKQGRLFTPGMIVVSFILGIIVFLAVFSDWIAPFAPDAASYGDSMMKPFQNGHILGTDRLGRDLFSRIICGAKISILNALLIVCFETVVGVPLGLICGYFGGKIDEVVMRIWDIVCALPSLLLAFVLVAAFGKGQFSGVIALGIVYTPLTAKLARSLIITEKTSVYVESARSLGYSNARIIFIHIFPNCITTMVAQLTLDIGSAITAMASLSFLGLGVQPPQTDWGSLLQNGMSMMYENAVLLVAPALAIMITSISINIFSDGIQAYLDPTQRKLPSFKKWKRGLGASIKDFTKIDGEGQKNERTA